MDKNIIERKRQIIVPTCRNDNTYDITYKNLTYNDNAPNA